TRLKPGQQTLMRLQQQHGNQFVQRHLAQIQREEAAKKKEEDSSGGGGKGFDLGEFVSKQVYDAIKKNMGDDKLKGYANQVAKLAAGEILKLISQGQTDPNALEKAAAALSKTMLTTQLDAALKEIFAGPAGQKLRSELLSMSQDPHKAVGLAIVGLAIMVASNAEIPELKKEFKLGGGFSASGEAKLGKFQEIAIHNVNLGLKYSSKHFGSTVSGGYSEKEGGKAATGVTVKGDGISAGVSGEYKSEGEDKGASGKAEVVAGTEEVQAKLLGKLTPAGNFNINFGSAINLEKFALSGSGTYDSIKGWSGVGELRLGPKQGHLSVKQSFNPNGESSLAFGPQIHTDVLKAIAMLNMSAADQTLDTSVTLTKPFGVKDLSMKAFLLTDIDDGILRKAGLDGNWTLHQKVDTQGVTQSLILLTFNANFVAQEGAKPAGGEGAVLLQGFW
ncbi:MAG: hypothetical protein KDE59_08755, partial [Anaerolineales bacterium]|nr:hypothetical protein [Anaerolineales bacterium]